MSETTSALYTHPTIRNVKASEFSDRLDAIRSRRLVAAMEFRTASNHRLRIEHEKLNDKWEALASKIDKKLFSILEALDTSEKDINKLIALNNQMAILE